MTDMKQSIAKEITIQGKVFPAKWDENRNVLRVVIDTTDQDEYHVDHNKKGKELLALLRQMVEVTGTIREDEDGDLIINVREYTILAGSGEGSKVHV
jgi:hypothetical protein